MSTDKKVEAVTQPGLDPLNFDRAKHKQEVKKMKLLKQKRRMKMTDRRDDIKRDSTDSEVEFLAGTLPQEQPQEEWLNDLLGPSSGRSSRSSTSQASQRSTQSKKSKRKQAHIQETNKLCSLMSQAQETVANYPLAFALLVAAAVLIGWVCNSSKS